MDPLVYLEFGRNLDLRVHLKVARWIFSTNMASGIPPAIREKSSSVCETKGNHVHSKQRIDVDYMGTVQFHRDKLSLIWRSLVLADM